jgi:hypothetical protein
MEFAKQVRQAGKISQARRVLAILPVLSRNGVRESLAKCGQIGTIA